MLLFDDAMMSDLIHPSSLTVSAGFLPLGPPPAQIRCLVSSRLCNSWLICCVGLDAAGQLTRDDVKGNMLNVQFD